MLGVSRILRGEALLKEDSILPGGVRRDEASVHAQTILDSCEYEKTRSGTLVIARPRNRALLSLLAEADDVSAKLKITPAVGEHALEWLGEYSNAWISFYERGELAGLVTDSQYESPEMQEYMASKQGGFAPPEMAILGNALHHIASRGREDIFNHRWVRVSEPGIVLRRRSEGIVICDEEGRRSVGCTAYRAE